MGRQPREDGLTPRLLVVAVLLWGLTIVGIVGMVAGW
jgi:preprotein translocase subunit Sss1